MTEDIPESIRQAHPELDAVAAALDQHRAGEPVTATCPRCGGVLTVTETPTGGLYVTCPNGHTLFRARTGNG
jgi:uncharacterized C2H2 Zn-finger protein